jgi:ATP-dependent protease ClpP protease subunit
VESDTGQHCFMLIDHQIEECAADAWNKNPALALTFVDLAHFNSALRATTRATVHGTLNYGDCVERLNKASEADAAERLASARNPDAMTKLSNSVDYSNGRLIVWLYGLVGGQITASEILGALKQYPSTPVVLRICSAGGDAHVGLVIAEALSRTPARTVAIIDRFAFSAAADIALSCDRVFMRTNATMFVHQSRGVCAGDADQLIQKSCELRGTDQRAAGLCTRKRRVTAQRFYELAKAETYLSAEQALAEGVIDAVLPSLAIHTEFHREA